jgi:Ni2+-binding GTPase involved in maturation of urease and hydrogenase
VKKFAVFSGFLGSGKTTAMMALTKYCTGRGTKSAMISNDLGEGVNLADNRLAQLSGCNASEITDNCICYVNEQLAERLDGYYSDGCELVISDIPGFGVGALEHVYHGLTEKFPGHFELAPFTVLVEPRTIELLRSGKSGDMEYIFDTQLVEADLIVLNKCDTISAEQKEKDLAWLSARYPEANAVAISAATGEGFDALSRALTEGTASMRRPDIAYGGERFSYAMGKISEYYIQYHASVCCDDFDGTAYLSAIAGRVQKEVAAAGCEIPHLKLLAWEPEGDFAKLDLLGTGRGIETVRSFSRRCTDIAVILNASAACPKDRLDEIITGAVEALSKEFNLEPAIFKKECFGMME